jgi:hypothetical protein
MEPVAIHIQPRWGCQLFHNNIDLIPDNFYPGTYLTYGQNIGWRWKGVADNIGSHCVSPKR